MSNDVEKSENGRILMMVSEWMKIVVNCVVVVEY